jgi:hypothetical protein
MRPRPLLALDFQEREEKNQMQTLARIAAGLIMVVSLAGCYESADVTIYEPGEYKGPKDPLLQGNDRTETLKKRFSMVQTDR